VRYYGKVKKLSAVAFVRLVVASALLLSPGSSSGTICVDKALAPLRKVCGVVVTPGGDPIPNAKLKILKHGTELAAVHTEQNGRFVFDKVDAGDYEIQIEANGFGTVRYAIVVAKPGALCKKMLRIQLPLGIECVHVQIVKK
jgi:Carboxypeptidase regulatory-like domain